MLTLYNPDPTDLLGHRLVAQDDGANEAGRNAVLDLTLPGQVGGTTYYVAVSGAGNQYFTPLIADSGFPGSTGVYGLQITATRGERHGPSDVPSNSSAAFTPPGAVPSPSARRSGLRRSCAFFEPSTSPRR